MKFTCFIFILFTVLFKCDNEHTTSSGKQKHSINAPHQIVSEKGTNIKDRFNPPRDFKRAIEKDLSFQNYLRTLRLKDVGSDVYYYNGSIKNNYNIYAAVLDQEISNKDLHQCADAVIRLRAEYLYAQNRLEDIAFTLTNGHKIDFIKWSKGYRINVNGNKTKWVKSAQEDSSINSFRKYLEFIYMYAGTYSLSKELKTQTVDQLKIGDVFIQGGHPGHVIMVMDMAINEATGEIAILLGQSYMPAQEFHILQNNGDESISPWYIVNKDYPLITPEWNFEYIDLMQF